MKNVIRIKIINPACQVVVLYKELMTYGFRERYYTEARERGALFVRYTDDAPLPFPTSDDYAPPCTSFGFQATGSDRTGSSFALTLP